MKEEKYLEMPWSMEDTIENLGVLKKVFQVKVVDINIDGKGEQDAKEVAFDFDRAIEALEKQTPKKMAIIGCEEKRIARCPSCSRNMAVAYLRDGEISGTKCIGDVPEVANYCKFCGQALLLDWSEKNE